MAVIIFKGIIWLHVSISYIENNNMADARKFKVEATTGRNSKYITKYLTPTQSLYKTILTVFSELTND